MSLNQSWAPSFRNWHLTPPSGLRPVLPCWLASGSLTANYFSLLNDTVCSFAFGSWIRTVSLSHTNKNKRYLTVIVWQQQKTMTFRSVALPTSSLIELRRTWRFMEALNSESSSALQGHAAAAGEQKELFEMFLNAHEQTHTDSSGFFCCFLICW